MLGVRQAGSAGGCAGRASTPPPAPHFTHLPPTDLPAAPPLLPALQSVTDKLKDKLEADDKEKIEGAVKEALEWLDENQVCGGDRAAPGCCTLAVPSAWRLRCCRRWLRGGDSARLRRWLRRARAPASPAVPLGCSSSLPGRLAGCLPSVRCPRHTPPHAHWSRRCRLVQEAEKEDYEEKLKEVQDICSPIISKVGAARRRQACQGGVRFWARA